MYLIYLIYLRSEMYASTQTFGKCSYNFIRCSIQRDCSVARQVHGVAAVGWAVICAHKSQDRNII
jgi:hypothetical protein